MHRIACVTYYDVRLMNKYNGTHQAPAGNAKMIRKYRVGV